MNDCCFKGSSMGLKVHTNSKMTPWFFGNRGVATPWYFGHLGVATPQYPKGQGQGVITIFILILP